MRLVGGAGRSVSWDVIIAGTQDPRKLDGGVDLGFQTASST